MPGDAKIWGPHDQATKDRVRDILANKELKHGKSPARERQDVLAAEARAALLAEVLAVVDDAFDAEELRMPVTEIDGALKALHHVRNRIAALNETNEEQQ